MSPPSLARLLARYALLQSVVWLVVGAGVLLYLIRFVRRSHVEMAAQIDRSRDEIYGTAARQLVLLESTGRSGEALDLRDDVEFLLWQAWLPRQDQVLSLRVVDVSGNVLVALHGPRVGPTALPPLPPLVSTPERPLGAIAETEALDLRLGDASGAATSVTVRRWAILSRFGAADYPCAVLELAFAPGAPANADLAAATPGLWRIEEGRLRALDDSPFLGYLRKTNELENYLQYVCDNASNLGLLYVDVKGRGGDLIAGSTSRAFWVVQPEPERRKEIEALGASDTQEMTIAYHGIPRGSMVTGWSLSRGSLGEMEADLDARMRRMETVCVAALLLTFGLGLGIGSALLVREVRLLSRPLLRLAHNVQLFASNPAAKAGETTRAWGPATDANYEEVRSLTADFVTMARQIADVLRAKDGAYHELAESQKALRQQARLATLGELGAGVAHEVNNKLNPARMRVEDLLLDLERGRAPGKDDILFIMRQIDEVAKFVSRFKNFAKPSSESQGEIDVREVVESAVALLQRQLEKSAVVIETDLGGVPTIRGNENELGQVLMNMFLNARDAIEPTLAEGKEHGTIRVRSWEDRGFACISVADDGAGMTQDVKSRLFRPFFTTKGPKGTGLGLAVCQQILKRHGAQVDIVTAPGKGTTFTMLFPNSTMPRPEPVLPATGDSEGDLRSPLA